MDRCDRLAGEMAQVRRGGTTRGFKPAGRLAEARIKAGARGRGFAVSRLLTHWAEVIGEEVASIARPVDIRFGRGGTGATLTLLTTGARAPMLEMMRERIREKVNGCYGYNAVARVRITQTAPTGFAEGQPEFVPAPRVAAAPGAEQVQLAAELADEIGDRRLRAAIAALGAQVLARDRKT